MFIDYGAVSSGDEPVSVADMKTHLHIDSSTEDAYLAGLRIAAREYIERRISGGMLLAPRSGTMYLDRFPKANGEIEMPATISSSSSDVTVGYYDTDGSTQTLAASRYAISGPSRGSGRLTPVEDWPDTEIMDSGMRRRTCVEISFLGGSTVVPEVAKHGIKLLAAHWYENRETEIIGSITQELKVGIDRIADLLDYGFYR